MQYILADMRTWFYATVRVCVFCVFKFMPPRSLHHISAKMCVFKSYFTEYLMENFYVLQLLPLYPSLYRYFSRYRETSTNSISCVTCVSWNFLRVFFSSSNISCHTSKCSFSPVSLWSKIRYYSVCPHVTIGVCLSIIIFDP